MARTESTGVAVGFRAPQFEVCPSPTSRPPPGSAPTLEPLASPPRRRGRAIPSSPRRAWHTSAPSLKPPHRTPLRHRHETAAPPQSLPQDCWFPSRWPLPHPLGLVVQRCDTPGVRLEPASAARRVAPASPSASDPVVVPQFFVRPASQDLGEPGRHRLRKESLFDGRRKQFLWFDAVIDELLFNRADSVV
ncbi:hypothetical protein PVAP13_3NG230900 [Panicum virgatum]|uniref:Uncharacterized protein n=1 Tax=Panicum virgatum TaxID=38727 RepID=A0A8T0UL13_PANVG|nr:hypothetical protein PVAP13_3NG230900 [Panicum virgatum]